MPGGTIVFLSLSCDGVLHRTERQAAARAESMAGLTNGAATTARQAHLKRPSRFSAARRVLLSMSRITRIDSAAAVKVR